MAQFTVHGRLKPLFNGDGMPITGFEPKATFPPGFHERKLKLHGSSGPKLRASPKSSSPDRKYRNFYVEASLSVRSEGIHDGSEETDELERDELSCFRGLVLDVSYRPVNVVCWKRAICLEFLEKADVLEYYDQTVNSPGGSFYIPAVLRVPQLLQVVKRRRIKNTLSRKNILFRDSFTCQRTFSKKHLKTFFIGDRLFKEFLSLAYCSLTENLTIDHVLPMARGGKWTWENLVTACSKCNSKKGQKTVEEANMKLLKVPKAPKDYDILAIPLTNSAIRMLRKRGGTPEEWRQYLSNQNLEP